MAVGAADIAAVPSDGVGGNSLTRGAGKRDAARERRRSQLIAATIKCISRSGLAGVTMQEITREAGLSLGIVNLHFDTKQKLLIETLRSIAEEYRAGWRRILDGDRSAAERLAALVDFDFSTRVVQRGKLSVWFAFWGETKTRPTYRRICAEVDRAIDEELCGLCTQLVAEGALQGRRTKAGGGDLFGADQRFVARYTGLPRGNGSQGCAADLPRVSCTDLSAPLRSRQLIATGARFEGQSTENNKWMSCSTNRLPPGATGRAPLSTRN